MIGTRTCAIAVMAKAPRTGSVKTRLVPPLTHDQARALSASFLKDTTENIAAAAQAAAIDGYIAYAPAGAAALFDGMLAPGTGLVLADGAIPTPPRVEGFGRSLLHAAEALFAQGYASVCLLNSDSPTLPTSLLRQAADALARPGDRIVLGPAEDGGYYLLGMKAPHAHLFEDVEWSTPRVADQTRARGVALGLEAVELAPWYDVDDRAALVRLLAELSGVAASGKIGPAEPYHAPATAGCLARLGLWDRVQGFGFAPSAHATARNLIP